MDLLHKKNSTQNNHSLLSATLPRESILKINNKQELSQQTKLKQRKKIKIYIEEDKFYIEHSTAYALGLIKTRAVMLDKPKLIEVSAAIHTKLKSDNDIDIEYIKIEKKPKLKVYIDNSNYCIDNAAAYSLGWLSIEQFSSLESEYYYIDKSVLEVLNNQYEIEFYSLNLHNATERKR